MHRCTGRLPLLVQVWTADFGKFLSEFATQSEAPPEQLAWCGTDSVVLYWEVHSAPFLLYLRGHCRNTTDVLSSCLLNLCQHHIGNSVGMSVGLSPWE